MTLKMLVMTGIFYDRLINEKPAASNGEFNHR